MFDWLRRLFVRSFPRGIADCDRAIALRPDHADTYSNRGLCRAAHCDKEGARADFLQALELAGTQRVVEEAVNGLRAQEQKAE
jgi:Flp pilus assembly protein TadD